MADQDVKALLLQIDANTQLLRSNLAQAEQAVAKFQTDTQAHLNAVDDRFYQLGNKIGTGLRGAFSLAAAGATAFAAALAGAGLISLAKQGLDYASSLQETSQQLGVTAKDLQIYRYAATQVGIEQADLDKGLSKLTVTMGKAELGAKGPVAAFNALGISLTDLKGKTAGDIIPKFADGLSKIGSPAQRAAIEVELLGKAGQKLETLFSGGSDQINQFADAAQRLGLVLSDKEIQDADNAADKLAEVKKVLEANVARVVADNATAILSLANAFESAALAAAKFTQLGAGALRILQNEGFGSLVFGHGVQDRLQAATAQGYSVLALQERNKAKADYDDAVRSNSAGGISGFFSQLAVGGNAGVAQKFKNFQDADKRSRAASAAALQAGLDDAAATRTARQQITNSGGDAPKFLTPAGPKGPKGPSAEKLAEQEAQRRRAAIAEQAREDDELASLTADLTADAQQRLAIELGRTEAAGQAKDDEIAQQLAAKKLTPAEAEKLKATNDQITELKKQQLLVTEQTRQEQEALDTRLAGLQDREDLLRAQSQLATTSGERLKIELQLLDLQQQEVRARLQEIANSKDPRVSAEAKARAQSTLSALPDIEAAQRAGVVKQNQGPLGQYLDTLPRTADQVKDAFQQAEVDGLKGFTDGLTNAATAALHLHGVLGTVIGDLLKIGIEREFTLPIANALFGGATGGGGLLAGLFGGGKASGGPVSSSKFYVVGENGPEIFAPGVSGSIIPNGGLRSPSLPSLAGAGGGGRQVIYVQVDKSALFDAHVHQIAAPLAQAAMIGAVGESQRQMARAAARKLGR
jgi:hypothetical protein